MFPCLYVSVFLCLYDSMSLCFHVPMSLCLDACMHVTNNMRKKCVRVRMCACVQGRIFKHIYNFMILVHPVAAACDATW